MCRRSPGLCRDQSDFSGKNTRGVERGGEEPVSVEGGGLATKTRQMQTGGERRNEGEGEEKGKSEKGTFWSRLSDHGYEAALERSRRWKFIVYLFARRSWRQREVMVKKGAYAAI